MIRPFDTDSAEDALIAKIRELTAAIALADQVAKHPERFPNDHRAAAARERAAIEARLNAVRRGSGITVDWSSRKHR